MKKYLILWMLVLVSVIVSAQKKITITSTTLKRQKNPAVLIQQQIDKQPKGSETSIILPVGSYNLLSNIVVFDKTVNFIGGGGTPGLFTQLWYYNDSLPAFIFSRKDIGSTALIQNIKIGAAGGSFKHNTQHGIVLRVPTIMKDCIIENFGGNGLDMHGSAGEGTDVSASNIRNVKIRSCGGDGVFIRGGDANACNFYMLDVRDNKGWGINDASFLGNKWDAIMAHANGEETWRLEQSMWKGNYTASDINNRSTFVGCYSESGSPPSVFGGSSVVLGGLLGYNRFILKSWAMAITDGNYFDDPDTGRREHILKAPYDKTKSYVEQNLQWYSNN